MATAGERLKVRSADGTAIVDLPTEVDAATETVLGDAYTEAAAAKGTIALNFSGVDYINSTGIAIIVGLLARARADGHVVKAFGLSDHYREIFEITRLSDFMAIFPSESSALGPR